MGDAMAAPIGRVMSGAAQATRRWQRCVWALVAGVWLAGCSSLPVFVPDLSRRQAAPVLLAGAHGVLSASRSKAVLDRLAQRGEPTDIFERHLALEEAIVGSPLTTGNRVRLLQDGPATYAAMLASIAGARDHVNMETYILEDDAVGRQFAQALMQKQRAGVQVNLIHDSVGTLNTPQAFFDELTAAGVRVLEFNPVNPLKARNDWELNQRDHRKLLIVDGRTAFLGGVNISNVYSGGSAQRRATDKPAWRDTHLQLQGPVVAEVQKLFLAAWASQGGPALTPRDWFPAPQRAGQQVVRAIGSSPDEPFTAIYATLLSAIASAQTSIQITVAYFAPDPRLQAALQSAAARGVAVTLILPGQTDSWLVFNAGRARYTALLEAGVRIVERQGAVLHAKTALIDGVWSTVGSTNLDWRSLVHNHELNAVVLGQDFGQQVQAMFDKDLTRSTPISLVDWRQRGLLARLKEWFASWWEYWL